MKLKYVKRCEIEVRLTNFRIEVIIIIIIIIILFIERHIQRAVRGTVQHSNAALSVIINIVTLLR